jgi:L-fuconolactonase
MVVALADTKVDSDIKNDVEIIDAHHHLWHYSPQEYGWIDDGMALLRRDFLPSDLAAEMRTAGVTGSVAVQARQSVEETQWLLDLAATSPILRAVVGWAPIAEPAFPAWLEKNSDQPKLKGLRHVVQAEPDPDFMLQPAFAEGIRALARTGLVYDILIFERQLDQAIRFVDQHPNQIFVLDHIAKPRIADAVLEPWAQNIRSLARRPNVFCKLSGMVTEADWRTWSPSTLAPYFDVVLEAFTPQRLMIGTDWPVCLLATSYVDWVSLVRQTISTFSSDEQQRILGRTAKEVYRIT